jgi:hypothetical protein
VVNHRQTRPGPAGSMFGWWRQLIRSPTHY